VGIGRADVRDDRPFVKRVLTPPRAVDKLVGDDQVSRLDVGLEAPGGARTDDPRDAELFHRPEVGPIVDRSGRYAVVFAVPRQKGHTLAAHFSERHFVAWRAVRRLDPNLL